MAGFIWFISILFIVKYFPAFFFRAAGNLERTNSMKINQKVDITTSIFRIFQNPISKIFQKKRLLQIDNNMVIKSQYLQ